jgi:hypothetical protein
MEYPWIFAISMVLSAPLIWVTLVSVSQEFMEAPAKGGGWPVLGAFSDFSVASWSLTRLPLFLLVCSVHISLVYNVALWFLL